MVFLSTILMSVSMSVTPTAWGQRWRLDEVPTVGRVLPGPRSWAQTQAKLTRNHSELHAMRELTLGNARRSAKPKPNTRERVESTEALSSTQPHGQPNCQCERTEQAKRSARSAALDGSCPLALARPASRKKQKLPKGSNHAKNQHQPNMQPMSDNLFCVCYVVVR